VIVPAIGVGPLGSSEWSVGGLGTSVPSPVSAASHSGQSFGDTLSNAIGALENSQASATTAS